MIDEGTLDPAEVAPLIEALRASSGDARATILEALARLPIAAADLRALGVPPPARPAPLRPPWADGEPPGFTAYPASASVELDARLAGVQPSERSAPWEPASPPLDEDLAPAAVTRWFAQAVGEDPDVGLGDRIVAWVHAYDGLFRPDLEGLFAQYRRAALAEATLRDETRIGYRSLRRQIGWTVSRGGLRGLVPGVAGHLLAEHETERTIAAQLIADAADAVATAEPAFFGGEAGPPARLPAEAADPALLPDLLRQAARAGILPASAPIAEPPAHAAAAPAPPMPPAPPARRHEPMPGVEFPTEWDASPRRAWPAAALVGLTLLGAAAILKWVLGWLTAPADVDVPRLDDIQCTVFAAPATPPGSTILVQVFAHVPTAADDARAIAAELDTGAVRRVFRTLDAPVAVGNRLDFELRMPGLEIDDHVASLTWHGRTEAVQFGVFVPKAVPAGRRIGTVSVSRDGIPLGHLKFALEIVPAGVGQSPEPQGIEGRRYRFAFVSYASQDRDEVLRRVQMLSLVGLECFQDVLDLEPGQVWSDELEHAIRDADVFLLFWSSRAKASEWVRKEVDFALACRAGDELSPPEIRPVIIEGPPVIEPWDDLAHLHFNDRVLYFMGR